MAKKNIFKQLQSDEDREQLKRLKANKKYALSIYGQLSEYFNLDMQPSLFTHKSHILINDTARQTVITIDNFRLNMSLSNNGIAIISDTNGVNFYGTISDPLDCIMKDKKNLPHTIASSEKVLEIVDRYGYIKKEQIYSMHYQVSISFTKNETRYSKKQKIEDIISIFENYGYPKRR